MTTFAREIKIAAPVEKVFSYLTEPTNWPEVWPSMVEVKDVQRLPNGGNSFGWVYKMAGLMFEGDNETTDFQPNQHVATQNVTGIHSKFDWTYRRDNGGTLLSMKVEYTVPVPVLGKLAENIIVKMNEQEANTMLENIKARMEG